MLRVRILYILYTIVQYCTVFCTILHADIVYKIAHCPAPAGAVPACCPAPGWADSLASVVSPHPCCRPAPVQLQCKSPGRALLFRNAPAAHSSCDLRRPATAASGWRRRAVVMLQGVDETVNVLHDAAVLDNLDDGLTAGAALAFLGCGELLVPFEKLGAEKRPPSRVRWLSLASSRTRALCCRRPRALSCHAP